MPSKLLWIVKDPSSECLSQSTRSDESKIRRHVQINRLSATRAALQSNALPEDEGATCLAIAQQHRSVPEKTHLFPPKTKIFLPLAPSDLRLTHTESRGLEFFIHRTARECSGWQDDHFWNTLVIQTCHASPGIAHGLVSIAAWHRGLSSLSDPADAAQSSALASSQWLKALASGRTSASISYSTSLIHCVVLACLQAHRSDYQDFRLLRSAAAMLQELDSLSRIVSASERELIDRQVRPLVDRLQARICTMGDSPAALKRSAQIRQSHGIVRRERPTVPVRFSTLREARDCLESIFGWAHDHVLDGHESLSKTPTPSLQHILNANLHDWWLTLSARSNTFPTHATILLRLASLHGLILIQTCTASNETAFDAHIPIFRTMMQLVTSLGPTYSNAHTVSFGIDSGLIDIVAFVASRCREPSVRRAAIGWLQTASRTEGERPSVGSAQIARAWMRLEEGGLARPPTCADEIPEDRRWRLVCGARYHARALVRLEFAGGSFGEDGDGGGERNMTVYIEESSGVEGGDGVVDVSGTEGGLGQPDVLIGRCGAAFLEDENKRLYHHVQIERFYFPIPRI